MEVPNNFNRESVHLSRVLDDIGVNEKEVEYRRNLALNEEELMSKNDDNRRRFYIFGSQSEGTVTIELKSDIDCLVCDVSNNAIQDWAEWTPDMNNFMLLQENTFSGHRLLQLSRADQPLPVKSIKSSHGELFCERSDGYFLKNTILWGIKGRQIHGPAVNEIGKLHGIEVDAVFAIRCKSWPTEADDWKRRYQTNPTEWITHDLLKKAEAEGFFLVPVSHKHSKTPGIDWRVSLSYTERLLMFSLNETQIRCYVILKMIIKTFITPQIGNSLTSYHCKTALFHCIEQTGTGFWVEERLLHGIILCLDKLLTFIREGNCPHFMMPQVNLFDGKVTPSNSPRLVEILSKFVQSDGNFLYRLKFNDLGNLLQARLCNPNMPEHRDGTI